MLSKETLERYRRMTPGQRLKLSLQAIDENESALLYGRKDVVDRRFQLLDRENQFRVRNILQGLSEEKSK